MEGIAIMQRGFRNAMKNVHRMSRCERGITIPELLIALVISASVAGLIGTAVFQLFVASSDGNAQLTVLQSVQNASVWLGRDISEAQSFSAGSGNVYGTFTTGDSTVEYRYSYDPANQELIREHLISSVVQSTSIVARRIASQSDIVISASGNLISVSITATSDGGTVTQTNTLDLAMRVH